MPVNLGLNKLFFKLQALFLELLNNCHLLLLLIPLFNHSFVQGLLKLQRLGLVLSNFVLSLSQLRLETADQ